MQGTLIRLRALEPADIEALYAWENDPAVWRVSGTTAPFSRRVLERFLEEQQFDILQTQQQRLIIERLTDGKLLGALDIFELDMLNRRAGIGLLIAEREERGKGYAADAMAVVCRYAAEALHLHQLWCNAGADNPASLALCRKAGFTVVGTKRDWQATRTGFVDEILTQKLLE